MDRGPCQASRPSAAPRTVRARGQEQGRSHRQPARGCPVLPEPLHASPENRSRGRPGRTHSCLVLRNGVFLSVDIDVCDPGHAPGTGTPEPGGLSARELLDSVRRICLELPVVGLDVVEVSPPYDHAEITAALANRVVLEALSAIARRRQVAREGTVWNPDAPLLDGR